jgi:hypothetical protein
MAPQAIAALSLADALGAVVTLVVGVATLFFAYNYRRQLGLRTAERRIDAYGELWTAMHVARPTRLEIQGEVVSQSERDELETQMSAWYFTGGSGMLLTQDTRQLYLMAKKNLVVDDAQVRPVAARERIAGLATPAERERARGELAMRQLSLLRTQMKADLDIYGRMYGKEPDEEDRAFLRDCGLDPDRRPWRRSRLERLRRRRSGTGLDP